MREFIGYRLPVLLYSVVGIGYVFQGIRYLSTSVIMPYHLAVVNGTWEQVAAEYQTLLLGLLKGFGAGSLAAGIGVLLLALVPLRSGRRWARWTTPVLAGTYAASLVYVTRITLLPDAPPILISQIVLALTLLAWLCSLTRKASV
ncbi:MAG: hypothetical protein O3A63_00075 [Proteobacteria bacterium]|nr:hypothetical protein [Pseudomonadota bacterium]